MTPLESRIIRLSSPMIQHRPALRMDRTTLEPSEMVRVGSSREEMV